MQTAWRPTPASLAPRLAAAAAAAPTCRTVGLSAADPGPPGHAVRERTVALGHGAAAWERAADALLRWEVQREAGAVVAADSDVARVGATAVVATAFGPVAVLAPCRVVTLHDGPGLRGFAYATLPGHPLVGEERLAVVLAPDGRVSFRLRSVSRPTGLAALLPPASRAAQALVVRRWAAAARRLAAG